MLRTSCPFLLTPLTPQTWRVGEQHLTQSEFIRCLTFSLSRPHTHIFIYIIAEAPRIAMHRAQCEMRSKNIFNIPGKLFHLSRDVFYSIILTIELLVMFNFYQKQRKAKQTFSRVTDIKMQTKQL